MPNPSAKKRKPPVRVAASHVAQVILECGGITRDVARKLCVNENTVRAYIKRYPSCREAREDAISDLKSIATDTLLSLVRSKDRQATFFVLSRYRQGDGTWTARQEESQEESTEEPIEIIK